MLVSELQGHAIKNKDLLVASGAITLKGVDSIDELQEDEQAVSHPDNLLHFLCLYCDAATKACHLINALDSPAI